MAWVDLAIVVALALTTLIGFAEGFFRSVCSLGGLFLALILASWNYARVAELFRPLVHIGPVADTIAFLLVALVVVGLVSLVGTFLSKAFRMLGLGCLDRLAGAVFGFFQGALLITLCILVTVAFFPKSLWLTHAHLPRMFFGACHLSTHMTPAELADRVRDGLRQLEQQSPPWLHPGNGNV